MPLPDDIQIQELPDGVRYGFRNQRRGCSTTGAGCFFILVGLPLAAAVDSVLFLWEESQASDPLQILAWIGLAAMAFLCLWWIFHMVLAVLGAYVVELRGGSLWAGQRAGFWRSGKRVTLERITKLVVYGEPPWAAEPVPEEVEPEAEEKNFTLLALCEEEPALAVAWHPQAETALALAEDLRQRILQSPDAQNNAPTMQQPAALFDPLENGPAWTPRPSYSRVLLDEQPGGIVLTFPPTGFRGAIDLLWLLCMMAFLVGAPALVWLRSVNGDWRSTSLSILIGFCWVLAFFVVRASIAGRFLATTVRADDERLEIQMPGFFLRGGKTWKAAELKDVHGYATSVVLLLQGGEPVETDLPVRDAAESLWIAQVLRRALGLPRPEEAESSRV